MSTAVITLHRRPPPIGRITVRVKVENYSDPSKFIEFNALVDTGASHLVLPMAWKDQLGELESLGPVEAAAADQSFMRGELCAAVRIAVAGFRPVVSEVLFLEMQPIDEKYEPLLGYLVLEAIPAAVDMLGHRLVPVKYFDLK